MFLRSAEIFHVGNARGTGTNLRLRGRIVRGERSEVDVENGGDNGLAVELQKNFAGVAVLREQAGLANVGKIIFFFVGVIFENGFRLGKRGAGKKSDAHPMVDDAAGNGNFVTVIEGVQLLEIKFAAAQLGMTRQGLAKALRRLGLVTGEVLEGVA